ncbi:TfuA-like protein [Burkholderia cenocepacia]|uniref:TfuA-like protein n=1 Tax=Burkholderia cenocepacia TaxID=95486 RepID=UPI000F59199C|nr:TfuA-like protein [Burkholderia cenocepacia]RQU50044.1 hypothetical protein DF143_36575 [Burkholderia cenocepacia]RQV33874.1 hypothetical protein DF033_34010 [Burkholderia cenocepacia]
MLFRRREQPIVFGGPSLRLARTAYPDAFDYRPPIRRGDLHQLLDIAPEQRGCILITDGVFGESMAVSPCECIDVIRAGWLILGASSVGALRAADCCSIGMIGVGDIFFGYKMGYYHSDADVAVLYQSTTHEECTVSIPLADHLIHRFAHQYPLSNLSRRQLLRELRSIPWYERDARHTADVISRHFARPALATEFMSVWREPTLNPKAQDALLACHMLSHYLLKQRR